MGVDVLINEGREGNSLTVRGSEILLKNFEPKY